MLNFVFGLFKRRSWGEALERLSLLHPQLLDAPPPPRLLPAPAIVNNVAPDAPADPDLDASPPDYEDASSIHLEGGDWCFQFMPVIIPALPVPRSFWFVASTLSPHYGLPEGIDISLVLHTDTFVAVAMGRCHARKCSLASKLILALGLA